MNCKMVLCLLVMSFLLTSCNEKDQPTVKKTQIEQKTAHSGRKTLQPKKEKSFVAGPKLKPARELLAWLEKLPKGVRVRLPIVVRFTDETGLMRKDAFIGESVNELDEDSLFVKLDDTTMGIPLSSHLRSHRSEKATDCALWLEGTWGPALDLPMPGFDKDSKKYTFTVRRVLDPAKGEPKGTVFVEQ